MSAGTEGAKVPRRMRISQRRRVREIAGILGRVSEAIDRTRVRYSYRGKVFWRLAGRPGNKSAQLFELIRILLCHDGGTRIHERRHSLAFNHLDEGVDA